MTFPLIIDLILAGVLLLFIWLGARRGFILTLCSLAAVIVALVGANWVADTLAPKVALAIQPQLEQSIQESLEEKALEVSAQDSLAVTDVLAVLKEKGGLYQWAAQGIEDALRSTPQLSESIAHQAAVAATAVAEQLARGLLFLVFFLLILILWAILSHALDLVSKLPVLDGINRTLGGVLGAVKGLVILYVAAWILCDLTGKIPPETAEQTYLLSFLLTYRPLDLLLNV